MIRSTIVLAISCLMAGKLPAQDQLPVPLQKFYCSGRVEVQGGMNMGNQSAEDLSESESHKFRPGMHLGVRIYTEIGSGFSFMPGILFDQKGFIYEYSYEDNVEDVPPIGLMSSSPANTFNEPIASATATTAVGINGNTSLPYLSIPLIFGYTPLEDVKAFSLISGFNPAFLLGRKTKIDSFGSESEEKGTDDLRNFDLGLLIGVSYMFNNNIGVNALYDHGLINTVKLENAPKAFNRTIKIGLIYRLNFNPFFKESYTRERKNLNF